MEDLREEVVARAVPVEQKVRYYRFFDYLEAIRARCPDFVSVTWDGNRVVWLDKVGTEYTAEDFVVGSPTRIQLELLEREVEQEEVMYFQLKFLGELS